MVSKNLIVDNYIVATISSSLSKKFIRLSTLIDPKKKHNYFCAPSNLLNLNIKNSPIDTFGVLKKTKLLIREPIVGDQVCYAINSNNFELTSETDGIYIKSIDEKKFYFYSLENYSHKYMSAFFTNLKSKNINIIFPDHESVHMYSDDLSTLKKYIKKLFKRKYDQNDIYEFNFPKEIDIIVNDKIINNLKIENRTFLGMSFQLTRLLKSTLNDISQSIYSTNNQNYYINNLFFAFYNFFPNFLSSSIFKFLLRMNGAIKFSKQILEINNLYTYENHIFSNPIDDEQSLSIFDRGNFLPKIPINEKNKNLSEILLDGDNIICSSSLNISPKNNFIQLKHSKDKKLAGHTISKSSYDILSLDVCYYVVSSSGLIKMVDLNENLKKKVKLLPSKSKYIDHKQKSLDSFISKNYKPTLPKFNFSFKMPVKLKKQ